MRYRFSKMQGNENDFVVFDGFNHPLPGLDPEQVRHIAHRRRGVGCDQVLTLERCADADVHYRVYNADGSESMQCGNGARCVAVYLRRQGRFHADSIRARTGGGELLLRFDQRGEPQVNMGLPCFEPEHVPVDFPEYQSRYPVQVDGQRHFLAALSIANPHAVLQVDDTDTAPVQQLGSAIQQLPCFPQGVNVGFMQICATDHIRLRVFERGAGETPACGSGACAAVVAGHVWELLGTHVKVSMRGGELDVEWHGKQAPVWLTGPANFCFEGSMEL